MTRWVPYIALLLFLFLSLSVSGQSAWERSVLLEVEINEDQNSLSFYWPADPNANEYEVFKKMPEDADWGESIALLAGDATSFTDEEVEVGVLYDYAFFKKNFDPVNFNFCLEPGRTYQLVFNDMYGKGLCCNFGFGNYQLEACGEILAYGDAFGFTDTTLFNICDTATLCEEATLTIIPDMFPNGTSFILTDSLTGEIAGSSGPVGSFIAERPKYGFISAGIRVPSIEEKGSILLLVEANLDSLLNSELEELEMDLFRDHWKVLRHPVEDSLSVFEVKEIIQDYYQITSDLTALYLIGHIPVPYSGDIYPDTHNENHQGAWSADPYYAELNGNWTDSVANITTAQFERNHNVPGDGRWDQDSIPGKVELQMGRVDLSRMPSFNEDEVELTRRYLRKAHQFRHGQLKAERRALIDDNFGQAFAGPAASGWRNFSTMFGSEKIEEADYFETMSQQSYLWSYGCGPGSHLSSAGIGTTADFANDSLQSIFTMLFGSQFGDWDNVDNFLRAPLASGATLTNCWAGNPPWTFHQMAMGYDIGYCTKLSMNSINGVFLNGPQLVHMALLGDPGLRMFCFPPLDSIMVNALELEVELSWIPSNEENVAGYDIYRADTLYGEYVKLNSTPVADTFFIDEFPYEGKNVYQVKAVVLEKTASGSFFNQSLSVIDSLVFEPEIKTGLTKPEEINFEIFPNPAKSQISIRCSQKENFEGELRIFDAQGKLVLKREMSEVIRLNIQNWHKGIYFIKYREMVKKIVKL